MSYSVEAGKYYWFAIFASVDLQYAFDAGEPNQLAAAWGWVYPNNPVEFSGVYGPAYFDVEVSIYITHTPA